MVNVQSYRYNFWDQHWTAGKRTDDDRPIVQVRSDPDRRRKVRDRSADCDEGRRFRWRTGIQVESCNHLNATFEWKMRFELGKVLPIWMGSVIDRRTAGSLGYIRSVSLMQHSKYFSSTRSWRVHGRSESPKSLCNSSKACSWRHKNWF